jgi:hypothetical protein
MKIIKKIIHYWFAIVSVLSFLVGWGLLAHSLKPAQSSQTSTLTSLSLPALPTIQAYGQGSGNNGSGLNLVSPNNQSSSGFPLLRSGGS